MVELTLVMKIDTYFERCKGIVLDLLFQSRCRDLVDGNIRNKVKS